MSFHKTFCAFGCYVVDISKSPEIRVMPVAGVHEKDLKPERVVTMNLAKRLNNVPWDEVIMDTTGLDQNGRDRGVVPNFPRDGINLLTIGPTIPSPKDGGIYIERSRFFAEIRPLFDPDKTLWPPRELHPYEFMSSALRRGDAISRYHGFHATVLRSRGANGAIKRLSIKLESGLPIDVDDIDMTNRDQCDDPFLLVQEVLDPSRMTKSESVLDATSSEGATGAVFLSLKICVANLLSGPKEPISAG